MTDNPIHEPKEKSVSTRMLATAFAGLLAICGAEGLISYHLANRLSDAEHNLKSISDSQRDLGGKLTQRIDETDTQAADLQKQLASTRDRLGLTSSELTKTRQAAVRLSRQQKLMEKEQVETKGTLGTLTTDVGGMKQDVTSVKDEVASTKSDLQRVVGDLGVTSDLVAHNRTELEELKLLGQRDYYEFDIRKSKEPQHVGHVSIALRKTDTKRQKYTLNLVADDHSIEKKDKTANEPVQFYQGGYRQPTEIVVNHVYKDRIVGYVSIPKKKEDRPAPGKAAGAE